MAKPWYARFRLKRAFLYRSPKFMVTTCSARTAWQAKPAQNTAEVEASRPDIVPTENLVIWGQDIEKDILALMHYSLSERLSVRLQDSGHLSHICLVSQDLRKTRRVAQNLNPDQTLIGEIIGCCISAVVYSFIWNLFKSVIQHTARRTLASELVLSTSKQHAGPHSKTDSSLLCHWPVGQADWAKHY